MDTGMKYIIVNDKHALIFPDALYHKDAFLFFRSGTSGGKVTGAGYIGADNDGKLYTYGRSEGFNIDSKPEDMELIMQALHRPDFCR
jgi:hypothetical protein